MSWPGCTACWTGSARNWPPIIAALLFFFFVEDGYSTDAGCPGARRFAFVAGYAPAYRECVYVPPPPVDEFGNPLPMPEDGSDPANPLQRAGQALRDFFGGDPAKQVPPPPEQPSPATPVQ